MSDNPKGSDAWVIDPQTYLEGRAPSHTVSPAPRSLYLTMRDGVRLAIDIHLPQGPRPAAGFPAILIFTPYYRRFRLAGDAPEGIEPSPNSANYRNMFVPRGYALVVVDVRGTGASFGCRDSFRSPAERADYEEVIEWAAGQDWCDGNLGATGISYLGAACDFAAASGHPALKAIAPISAVWDTYTDHFYPGGILLTDLASGYGRVMEALDQDDRDALSEVYYFAEPSFQGPAPVDDDPDGILLAQAIAEHAANVHIPDFLREFQFRDDSLAHDPDFTPDSFSPHAASPGFRDDLAVMAVSGWLDGAYMNGSVSRFLSRPSGMRHLLLGPWDHGARCNASPFRRHALPEFPVLGVILRFFDEHLMGRDTGLGSEAPVHYHTMRQESWKAADQWPPVDGSRTLFLDGDRLADTPGPDGTLGYKADYAASTGLDTRYGRLQIRNVQDYYADWDHRPGTRLRFVSQPLDHPMAIAGHPLLHLGFSADQTDACIFAYLEDIAPDGTARYVTEGQLRALHREISAPSPTYPATWPYRSFTRADARPLTPGQTVVIDFALLPVSWQFPAGHQIGLAIAGADRSNFALWPYGRPGNWTIQTGGAAPSAITLPVE
ncbi:MAG: CocE/NonD family hydrolase [Paracoccaceae bacterium]|nr:CocE/NonD family hydrolase [Paracoccaceae bacterium]